MSSEYQSFTHDYGTFTMQERLTYGLHFILEKIKEKASEMANPTTRDDIDFIRINNPNLEFDESDEAMIVDASERLRKAVQDLIPFMTTYQKIGMDLQTYNYLIETQTSAIQQFANDSDEAENIEDYIFCINRFTDDLEIILMELNFLKQSNTSEGDGFYWWFYLSHFVFAIRTGLIIFGLMISWSVPFFHLSGEAHLNYLYRLMNGYVPDACYKILSAGLVYFNEQGLQLDTGKSWVVYVRRISEDYLIDILQRCFGYYFPEHTKLISLIALSITWCMTMSGLIFPQVPLGLLNLLIKFLKNVQLIPDIPNMVRQLFRLDSANTNFMVNRYMDRFDEQKRFYYDMLPAERKLSNFNFAIDEVSGHLKLQ